VNPDLTPGIPIRVAPGVQRLLAPNASPLTGPGTNTYLLGDPPVAVLDPGPAIPEHLAAIERCVPALETVFVTHTHPDHSPAAHSLATRSGARLVGRPPPRDGRQDLTFRPDQIPARSQRFEVAGVQLVAIDTPGHASNHVCYLSDGVLFSGDHVLDGVTPVILAPDGDMAAYLDSLRRLRELPLRAIAPGHGHVLQDPIAVIDGVIAHRERREAKVLSVLGSLVRATLDELLPRVYDDVRRELHPLARLSLEAHLIKLEREGRCGREGADWLAR
jgi:glyoxylase-like metal-dependent hydrolase (beta-lactamase superfamily II)